MLLGRVLWGELQLTRRSADTPGREGRRICRILLQHRSSTCILRHSNHRLVRKVSGVRHRILRWFPSYWLSHVVRRRDGRTVSAKPLGTTTRLVSAWTPRPTRMVVKNPDGEDMPKLGGSENGATLYYTRCNVVSPTVWVDICGRRSAVGSTLGFSAS